MTNRRGSHDSLDGVLWPVDGDGLPVCTVPDGCPVCVLFEQERPGESDAAWLTRIRDGAYRLSGQRLPDIVVPERPGGYGSPGGGKHQRCADPDCRTPWARHAARGRCTSCVRRPKARAS